MHYAFVPSKTGDTIFFILQQIRKSFVGISVLYCTDILTMFLAMKICQFNNFRRNILILLNLCPY